MSSSEPDDDLNVGLHRVILGYSCFVAVAVLLLFIVSSGKGSCRLHHPSLSPVAREVVALVVLLFVVVPYALFCISLFCGGWIALAEGWSFLTGFEYVLSSVSGVALALTTARPSTGFGDFVDVLMSVWAMLFANILMGTVASMALVARAIAMLPPSPEALLCCVFLAVPSALLVIAAVTGLSVSAAEGWPARDGFYFMVGSLCGLTNPLTLVTPATPGGKFVEVLAVISELFLGSAVIGVVSAHPVCQWFVAVLEGKDAEAELTEQSPEKAGSKLAWTTPVVPIQASAPPVPGDPAKARVETTEGGESEAAILRSELQSLQAKQRLMEVRLRNAEEAAGSAEQDVGQLSAQLTATQTVVDGLRADAAQHAEMEMGLQKRVTKLEDVKKELESEQRRLLDELSHLRDQMARESEEV